MTDFGNNIAKRGCFWTVFGQEYSLFASKYALLRPKFGQISHFRVLGEELCVLRLKMASRGEFGRCRGVFSGDFN